MSHPRALARIWAALAVSIAALPAQSPVSGRVVDENGVAVAGARVEFRAGEARPAAATSDLAGNFSLMLPAGEYDIRAARAGFFEYRGRGQRISSAASQITIVLNHLQEFSERVDVTYSPPVVDPDQTSDRKELDNTAMQAVPYPAPQDYRNSLALMNGVVQDNAGRAHFHGGDVQQTNYTLDGFNISDPVTGRLEARVNIGSIQELEAQTARFSAENGRGSAGVLDVRTKMGDDRWRFGGTNFVPGVSLDQGFHINKWTPRIELSGPLKRGRAWFHNGMDGFYSMDVIHGLPRGQNQTRGITASDIARAQVNLAPSNILTLGVLANIADNARYGLSIVNPAEATSTHRQALFVSSIRDQQYVGGALLEAGFADTRAALRDRPQGDELFQITPWGNRGNYFAAKTRHSYRQQWIVDVFLPMVRRGGEHQFKFGIDFERESFHQETTRHPYEVLRSDETVARHVTFLGSPFQARRNFEGAQYIQDRWRPREGVSIELGLRAEWNQIARDLEWAPRAAVVWAPARLATKFSAGWGVYYDAVALNIVTLQQGQVSLSTFFRPDGSEQGPLETSFRVDEHRLKAPRFRTVSLAAERRMPWDFFMRAEYIRRTGDRGFAFAASSDQPAGPGVYDLHNSRQDRYDAFDLSFSRTFGGQFQWFAGYTASRARTSAAVEYSLENPIFGIQAPGPVAWDTPHRFHMWGWAPLPNRALPRLLRFLTNQTTAAYLVEFRTGFPFGAVDEQGFLAGPPGALRYPDYFNINFHLERKFRFLHYLWAWRFGYNNLTNNSNPNAVNNITGTPAFLTYGRGQARAFSVRLRLLGRR